jgi:hypothetical protein
MATGAGTGTETVKKEPLPPCVDVAGICLHTLIIAQDLSGGRRRHGGEQQRVPHPVLGNPGLQRGPIVQRRGRHVPHVVLQDALAHRAAGVGLVGAVPLGQLAARLQRSVVDGLEDLFVEQRGLGRLEGVAHKDVGISEALNVRIP